MTVARLSAETFRAQAPPEWQADADSARARFATGSFAAGVELVVTIGRLADAADHHPDVVLRYPDVTVTLTTHDVAGLTERDVDLARVVSAAARAAGANPVDF